MALKQGFVTINNDPYIYQENDGTNTVSAAMGIDSTGTGAFKISVLPIPGAGPNLGSGFESMVINPLNGDITFNPAPGKVIIGDGLGSGKLVVDTLSAYAVVCGGITSTDKLQSVASLGASGEVLTSNGAGALPTWQALPSGGVSTFHTDSGDATESSGAITIAGTSNLIATSGSGSTVTLTLPNVIINSSNQSIYAGQGSGNGSTTAVQDVAVGYHALANTATQGFNTAIGHEAGASITDGNENTFVGHNAGSGITTGAFNVMVGNDFAGLTATTTYNILVGNRVTSPGDNAIVIGDSVLQNKCFIAGIRGITTGVNDAVAVLIDSAGQLGTVSSSIRYKQNVHGMGDVSNRLLDLRPVTFSYKTSPGIMRTGLIAEEVLNVMPDLVAYNQDGQPESVKYHDIPVLLLNELQKAVETIKSLTRRIEQLEKR